MFDPWELGALLEGLAFGPAPAVAGLAQGFTVSPDLRHMAFSASAEVDGNLLALELH